MKRTILTPALLAVAFLAACSDNSSTALMAPSSAAFAGRANSQNGTTFSENFNTHVPVASRLEATGGGVDYLNGQAVFSNGRGYLRTIAADYTTTSFKADVTVTMPGGAGGDGIAFIGIGEGTPDYNFFQEPGGSGAIFTRIQPNDFYGPSVMVTNVVNGEVIEGPFLGAGTVGGDGTHRVRISWNAAARTYTFAIQSNYVEGTDFVPTFTVGPIHVNGELNASNSHIFFGGAAGVSFDNLHVEVTP